MEDLDYERGHRTLKILRKGGRRAIIPLAPRTSRVVDLYLNERTTGPIFLGAKGGRMDRYATDRMVKRLARRAGITKRISPTVFATPSSPLPSTLACPCGMCRKRPATPIPGPPCATTEAEVRSIAMPPTSWPRSWLAPPAEPPRSARAIPGGDIARARRLPRGRRR